MDCFSYIATTLFPHLASTEVIFFITKKNRNNKSYTCFLLLQFAMAKHPHHHHVQNKDCYRCPPGYGVERHCNRFHDTECGACAPDHYSSHLSAWRPCYPCSRCGAGLYVAHKCTAARDTVCDSCHTYRGPHNEDFYERCVKPSLETNSVHSQSSQAKGKWCP
ncbi:UNVERIFIED_CONTAM: hypothetical protein NCL1_63341 [Trichonephila clavipes]